MGNEGPKVAKRSVGEICICIQKLSVGEITEIHSCTCTQRQEEIVGHVCIVLAQKPQEETVAHVFIALAQSWIRQTWQEAQRRIQGLQGVSRHNWQPIIRHGLSVC